MRIDEYMTVRELILRLQKFDPEAKVGVRAACCGHAHHIQEVREAGDDDFEDEADVVINARE